MAAKRPHSDRSLKSEYQVLQEQDKHPKNIYSKKTISAWKKNGKTASMLPKGFGL